MKKENQRIAIAEACGICTGKQVEDQDGNYCEKCGVKSCQHQNIPDYLNDLNAMHEAWLTLDTDQRVQFSEHLNQITIREMKLTDEDAQYIVSMEGFAENATPLRRAEAFLRTIGKWTDD